MRAPRFQPDADDPRLTGLSCCVCGKAIRRFKSLCWIFGPVAGPLAHNIPVSAHIDCVNGMTEGAVAALHQRAVLAAVTGNPERIH